MFILGTVCSVMTYTGFDDLDLIGPVPQALSTGARAFGAGTLVASIAILMLVGRSIALVSIYFTGNTRLPMVAGWDNLLPGWFSRLHRRHKTPVNSILFVGSVTLLFRYCESARSRGAGGFPAHRQRCRDLLRHCLPCLVRHPDLRVARFAVRAPLWLRFAAAIGSLSPCSTSCSPSCRSLTSKATTEFAAKIIITTLGANLLGALIFVAARRRRQVASAS